jgi:hypothetical protein
MTTVSWSVARELGLREWTDQGRRLGEIGRSIGWWIGDWLRYGNFRFGERYARAARITGYDPQTLMNMAYVASHVDCSRRRENLSWSHHVEVASLGPAEQDRWLARAENERMSVRCLREELRRERRERLDDGPAPASDDAGSEAVSASAPQPLGGRPETSLTCPRCGEALVGASGRRWPE